MSPTPDAVRGTPTIDVQFDRPTRRYTPGGPIELTYRIGEIDADAVRALEVSVAWYTEGKGEEDLAVHTFERIIEPDTLRAAIAGGAMRTVLPPSPLSYEGVIVKIRWCVRVRVFFGGGRDYVSEHVFEVGAVPIARPQDAVETAP